MLIDLEIICGLIALSLPVLGLSGVFSGGKIGGPPRMISGESVLTLGGILLLSVCTGVLGAAAAKPLIKMGPDQTLDVLNGVIYVVILAAALALSRSLRPLGLGQLGLTGRRWLRAVPLALLTALAVLPLVYASAFLVQLVMQLLQRAMPAAHPLLQQLQTDRHSIWFAVIALEAVLLAPLVEETLFRGFLQTILVYSMGRGRQPSPAARWVGVLLTAALFAAVHWEPAFFLPLFVLAVGLGYLYERTGNLWACIMLHGLFNALQIILYLAATTNAHSH